MSRLIILFLLFTSFRLSAQEVTERIYFFENLEIKKGTQLLLLTHRQQTHTAKLLGNRLFSDTNYIRKLKENSFKEVVDGTYEVHMCGYDMYFYSVNGDEVRFLNAANSQCGLNDLGCETLDTMLFSGTPLYYDTLDIGVSEWTAEYDSILKRSVLTTSYDVESWQLTKSKKFPKFYYDYYFNVMIENDPERSEREIIEEYLLTLSNDLRGINWHYSDTDPVNGIIKGPILSFQCYLKESRKSDFPEQNLIPVSKTFDPKNNYLLLKPKI